MDCKDCENYVDKKCRKEIMSMTDQSCLLKHLIILTSFTFEVLLNNKAEQDVLRRQIRGLVDKAKGKLDEGNEWKQ